MELSEVSTLWTIPGRVEARAVVKKLKNAFVNFFGSESAHISNPFDIAFLVFQITEKSLCRPL